jgi:hypothetical protein
VFKTFYLGVAHKWRLGLRSGGGQGIRGDYTEALLLKSVTMRGEQNGQRMRDVIYGQPLVIECRLKIDYECCHFFNGTWLKKLHFNFDSLEDPLSQWWSTSPSVPWVRSMKTDKPSTLIVTFVNPGLTKDYSIMQRVMAYQLMTKLSLFFWKFWEKKTVNSFICNIV